MGDYWTTSSPNLISTNSSLSGFALVWMIVSLILALIGCFVIYFLFDDKVKRYETILYVALLITVLFNVYILIDSLRLIQFQYH